MTYYKRDLRVKEIAILANDDVFAGSLAGAIDVFDIANVHVRSRVQQVLPAEPAGRSLLSVTVLATGESTAIATGPLRIAAAARVRDSTRRFDAVFVPAFGHKGHREFIASLEQLNDLYPWLRAQQEHGAVFAANHCGVFLLAESGLLLGHLAAVPRALEAVFRRRYPAVRLDQSNALIEDRNMLCAAALDSSLHLAWRLVERFRSGVIARQTARDLFFGDPTTLRSLAPDEVDLHSANPLVSRAQDWLMHNISSRLNLADLARLLSVSERSLYRHFRRFTGRTPKAYLQRIRVESAMSHLELRDDSIETIAHSVGYTDKAYFSRVFRKHTGMTPRAYRRAARQQRAGQDGTGRMA